VAQVKRRVEPGKNLRPASRLVASSQASQLRFPAPRDIQKVCLSRVSLRVWVEYFFPGCLRAMRHMDGVEQRRGERPRRREGVCCQKASATLERDGLEATSAQGSGGPPLKVREKTYGDQRSLLKMREPDAGWAGRKPLIDPWWHYRYDAQRTCRRCLGGNPDSRNNKEQPCSMQP
jgi:hypothetical protein